MRRTPLHLHAFTLLEMLLSLAVLASVSAMVAAIWSQADGWAKQNGAHHDAMHLQRTVAFMRNQWADRRTTVELQRDRVEQEDESEHASPSQAASAARTPGVSAQPTTLTFVTATPVIDPDAPIVIAEYRIERGASKSLGRVTGSRLVYRERPVNSLANAVTLAGDQTEHVLFKNCTNLRFERFGLPDPEENEDKQDAVEPEEHARPEWRAFDTQFKHHIPAVRLLGETQGEPFSCVFVIEASR